MPSFRTAAVATAATAAILSGAAMAQAGRNGARAFEQLQAADLDKDGAISRAELLQSRESHWQKLDRNKDGMFSQDDLPAIAKSKWDGDRLLQMRTRLDTNKDGRISRAEFVNGPMPMFDAADTNKDGKVDAAELQALKDREARP